MHTYHLGILSENIISFLKQQYILNISKQLVRLFTGALKANCWVAKAYRIIYGSDEMLVNARRGKVLGKHFPFNNGMTFFWITYFIDKIFFVAICTLYMVVLSWEFVSISRVINHMTWYTFDWSPLWKGYLKKAFTRFALRSECCNFNQ